MKKELLATVATLAAVACLLAACSGTEEKIPGNEPGGNPSDRVALCIEQASMSQADAVDTRAAETITERNMGVFLEDGGTNSYVPQKNVMYRPSQKIIEGASSTVWTSSDGLFLGTDLANVCAYWPYVATYKDSKAIPLTTQVYTAEHDLCFAGNRTMSAPTTENPKANETSFAMTHAYALLELVLKRDAASNIACPVSKIEITAEYGLNEIATLDITPEGGAGAYSGFSAMADNRSFTLTGAYNIPAGGSVTVPAMLIVPTATVTAPFKFTLTAFDPAITVSGSTTFPDTTFEKGKRYIVNLTVNSTSVGVSGVTVLDWTNTPIKPGGGGSGFVPLPSVP